MFRIDDPTADVTDPAKPIYTEGNPGTGTPATIVRADALNHLQEELANVVELNGGTLDDEDFTQVYDAIVAMIAATGAANKVAKAGDTMTGALNMSGAPINQAQGADIASSATPNIASATGETVQITGAVGITGFTAGTAGMRRLLRFTNAAPGLLTYSGNLILPGLVNFQPAQFDILEFYCFGGTTWGCIRVVRFNGTSAIARVASTTATGESELATGIETAALTDAVRTVTPLGLASLVASTTQKGLVLLTSTAEVDTGTDTAKAVTSAALAGSHRTLKAWWSMTGSTGAPTSSFGISSGVRNSTGNYTVNLTAAAPDANYSAVVSSEQLLTPLVSKTTTAFTYKTGFGASYNAADANSSGQIAY